MGPVTPPPPYYPVEINLFFIIRSLQNRGPSLQTGGLLFLHNFLWLLRWWSKPFGQGFAALWDLHVAGLQFIGFFLIFAFPVMLLP